MKLNLEMSKSQMKKRAARAFFESSSAKPREEGVGSSAALIMAGVPGAGKTEFISSLLENSPKLKENALRIDLDEIIKIFEEYNPEEDYKFRSVGNAIVESILDRAFDGGYNFILDGTFSGDSAIKNVERAINHGYNVLIVVLEEDLERAKQYARIRKEKTKRDIKDEVFEQAAQGILENIKKLRKEFIDKGKPVSIQAFRKDWSAEGELKKYEEVTDLDDIYKK